MLFAVHSAVRGLPREAALRAPGYPVSPQRGLWNRICWSLAGTYHYSSPRMGCDSLETATWHVLVYLSLRRVLAVIPRLLGCFSLMGAKLHPAHHPEIWKGGWLGGLIFPPTCPSHDSWRCLHPSPSVCMGRKIGWALFIPLAHIKRKMSLFDYPGAIAWWLSM